jgi:hypothetical protein
MAQISFIDPLTIACMLEAGQSLKGYPASACAWKGINPALLEAMTPYWGKRMKGLDMAAGTNPTPVNAMLENAGFPGSLEYVGDGIYMGAAVKVRDDWLRPGDTIFMTVDGKSRPGFEMTESAAMRIFVVDGVPYAVMKANTSTVVLIKSTASGIGLADFVKAAMTSQHKHGTSGYDAIHVPMVDHEDTCDLMPILGAGTLGTFNIQSASGAVRVKMNETGFEAAAAASGFALECVRMGPKNPLVFDSSFIFAVIPDELELPCVITQVPTSSFKDPGKF